MFVATLKATNSSFQKVMTFCRSTYVKKVMKLLAFIFEQPSYDEIIDFLCRFSVICDVIQKVHHNHDLIKAHAVR